MGERPAAPRFRRRLTAAFVLVAATAAGALAVITYVLSTGYRNRTFEAGSRDEANLALALAPEELTESSFARLQAAYESRTGASTLARSQAGYFSSTPGLDADDIPPELRDPGPDELAGTHVTIDGTERYVLASERDDDDYWFFFSREPVQQSLSDLRTVLALSWLLTVTGAALVGRVVARRTLHPVREAADAARSLAAGLFETRLDEGSDDEFGTWSASFNEMADALQATIERLEAAAERERRFTADVAHELRTPLTSMAAAASLLEDDLAALPPAAQRPGRLLITDVQRLRDLVLELLELARLDAGADPLESEPLELAPALRAVVEPIVAAADRGEGDVRVRAADGLVVEADRSRFRRVVGNLVENALRHGSPPVEVTARAEGTWVVIEVRDHGPGLQGVDPAALFDRFAKSDRSRSGDGAGLGLAIAAGHTEAMGGGLRAHDHPEGGASFQVRLRRASAPARA